jgi:aldehyde dehydrogenase (NAD+)
MAQIDERSLQIKLPNGKSYSQPYAPSVPFWTSLTGIGLVCSSTTNLSTPLTAEPLNPSILRKSPPQSYYHDGQPILITGPADYSRNGKVICSVQEATEKDVDIAVGAARKVYDDYNGPWRSMSPQARGQLLQKLGELFYREIETLAAVEALDNGKAFAIAKGDVAMSADCLKYYGGWSDKIHGKVVETDDFSFRYTRHESIGVCGQIIPWNFPLLMWAWKIGPAVATGNVVVLKTAEQTPLSALVAAKLVVEAGFPPGVINIISGFGKIAGAAISSHMGVDKVAFTGSTITGRSIMKAAADSNLKKVTLELGGKSPTIVFNDADLDAAIDWANFGIYFNHGIAPQSSC